MTTPIVRNLSPSATRILVACVAAMRPRGSGFDQPIDDDVLHQVDEFLPHLPPLMRWGFPWGLRLLEWGPFLFARPRPWRRMSRLPRAEAERYLEGWLEAGGLRGALLLGVRTLIFIAFYQHPDVLASLGVDWSGRARALTAQRAELLSGKQP